MVWETGTEQAELCLMGKGGRGRGRQVADLQGFAGGPQAAERRPQWLEGEGRREEQHGRGSILLMVTKMKGKGPIHQAFHSQNEGHLVTKRKGGRDSQKREKMRVSENCAMLQP